MYIIQWRMFTSKKSYRFVNDRINTIKAYITWFRIPHFECIHYQSTVMCIHYGVLYIKWKRNSPDIIYTVIGFYNHTRRMELEHIRNKRKSFYQESFWRCSVAHILMTHFVTMLIFFYFFRVIFWFNFLWYGLFQKWICQLIWCRSINIQDNKPVGVGRNSVFGI